jgi:hypothetical protein
MIRAVLVAAESVRCNKLSTRAFLTTSFSAEESALADENDCAKEPAALLVDDDDDDDAAPRFPDVLVLFPSSPPLSTQMRW